MITQLVMFSTIILLILTGTRFLQRGRETKYFPVRILAAGLFLIALSILFYAVRDILVQFKMYEIQTKLLLFGGIIHITGSILIAWFVTKEFGPKLIFQYLVFILLVVFLISIILISKLFPMGSELQQAPFEPIPYFIIRNYPLVPLGKNILLFLFFGLSALIFGIIFYNSLKVKERELKIRGLFYGLGFLFLIAPALVCLLISPIYARIGYLIGAILIYKAFQKK